MQILGGLLGYFFGPRGCLALLATIAVEIFVWVRFGEHAAGWTLLAMLILMFLPIGMRNGRAGMMRVLQVVVALAGVKFALAAYIQLTLGHFFDGVAWLSVAMTIGCYYGFRWLGRMIACLDEAAATAERRVKHANGGKLERFPDVTVD